jgi:putative methylase
VIPVKLRQLEMQLQKIEGFASPDVALEQYMTPAPLAARLLFHAAMNGNITGRTVCDLGCGTGMLSIGAALLGAGVTGIDADPSALSTAGTNAANFGVPIRFCETWVDDSLMLTADTVLMNPPFGAQKEHADRPFIDASLRIAPVVYGIFNAGTLPFLTSYVKDRAEILERVSAGLVIPKQFRFHRRETLEIPVEIVHMQRL